MERLFVDTNFPYVEIVELQNGSGWTLDRLADQIATKYFVRNMMADLVVVWLDKEKMTHSVPKIKSKILSEMTARGADPKKTVVCIPNKMTENVILADEDMIRKYFSHPSYTYSFDGKNGKYLLSELFQKKGISYKETNHGVDLLKKVRLGRAAKNCQAAADLNQALMMPCWWTQSSNDSDQ